MIISGIYKIESKIKPECIYIGSAAYIKKRWSNHLSRLEKNKHCNRILQNHYNKYGAEDLVFSIITECDKLDLIIKEQYYIDTLSPAFNICKIAGSSLGYKHTAEACANMSVAHKGNTNVPGYKHTAEALAKISEAAKNISPETRTKLSVAKQNMSAETRAKMSEAARLAWVIRKLNK